MARSGLVLPEVLPPPSRVAERLAALLAQPGFYGHLAATAVEVAASAVIALAAASVVAAACAAFRPVGAGLAPVLYYLAPTPKIIFLPVALGVFGVDMGSKIAIGAVSALFPIAISLVSGLARVEPIHLDVGRGFGLTARQMATKVYLPSLWGAALTGLRLGTGLAIIGVLLAETKLAARGLGFLAIQSYNAFRIADLYAVIVVTFILAALINWLISAAEARYAHAR